MLVFGILIGVLMIAVAVLAEFFEGTNSGLAELVGVLDFPAGF